MQQTKIAVEDNLTPVRDLLQQKGYEVLPLSEVKSADCVVVTGGDDNLMGIQTTLTKVPVIAALGMTAEEVVSLVQEQLK